MDIRQLRPSDMIDAQQTNITNLPENYPMKYYMYHLACWPELSYAAIDNSSSHPKVVGYVLAKLDEDPTDGQAHGHITSLSVMRTHRRLGLAEKLMLQTQRAMYETYGCKDVTLNVRMSNVAALALYKDTLGFTQAGTDLAYYGDKEDAYTMKKALDYLRDENLDGDSDDEPGLRSEGVDEGDAVGSEGKGNKSSGRTIKVGRPLGVGALVEKNEASR